MDPFGHHTISELIQLISEACLKWDYKRSSELQYLREFASKNFFPVGEHQNISSVQLKLEHDKYRQAMTKLLDICPNLFRILNDWCEENERRELLITDEMKKDQQTRYQDTTTKLRQQECAVLVFGDTGAGKSTLINTILEEDLMETSALKTTFAVCEVHYAPIKKYSTAKTEISQFEEQPFPSLSTGATTVSNREKPKYIREQYECPIDLLKNGIVIVDSPGLNDNETLTRIVQSYMTDCLVFICVINRGITKSLDSILNELKLARRRSAKSIFFVVTNLDDKEPADQQNAMHQIHSDLAKKWDDYDPIYNCCMLNPAKAFRIFRNHRFYERAHHEFLQKFIPFLSNALQIKLQYLFDQLYDIFKRLWETTQIKYNQSIMETHQSHELSKRIKMKKEYFNEVGKCIIVKTQPLANAFSTQAIDKILKKCADPEFKDKLEKHALTITLPSDDSSVKNISIGSYQFERNKDEWHTQLVGNEAIDMARKYKLSLRTRTLANLVSPPMSNVATATLEYHISFVELCKVHLQHRLLLWIHKEMTPVLEELTKAAICDIWNICCTDLQTIDNELRNGYLQLTDETDERNNIRRIEGWYNKILQQFTSSGSNWDLFTRTKLWFFTHTFQFPLLLESFIERFNGTTLEDMNQDENGFKLRLAQKYYKRIIEKLKDHKIKDDERVQKQEKNQHVTDASLTPSGGENLSDHSTSMINNILKKFELAYTEIEQLAQTEQKQANAKDWTNICASYKGKLTPIKSHLDGFQAVHLKIWPLKSNDVIREANILSENLYEGCCMYKGQLVFNEATRPAVHIRRLTDKFNVLDVYDECQNLARTNNHPHILHCYGVYTEDSELFVVTEPIHQTLETMLSDKSSNSLATNERIQLALELAQCIQHLYREKIHHYCIHTKSIMITNDRHIKLNMVGNEDNFLYISPECLLPNRDVTSFSDDIYSFGLVLYRLFHTNPHEISLFRSGKWLVPTSYTNETMISKKCYMNYVNQNHAIMTFQLPEISSEINVTVRELIKACCSVDVQQRPDINAIIKRLSIEKLRSDNPISFPSQNNQIKRYGLLSVDGGGSRGIIAAKIMEILEAKIGMPLCQSFDLAGGTSAGGLLVLSSMKRRTPADQLRRDFLRLSSKIFPFSRRLPTTEYSHEALEQELQTHFQGLKLEETKLSPKLFVVTKRSTDTQPYLLRNYVTLTENNLFYHGCSGWLCCDAARATSAAPTYFTAFVKDHESYTDGGVGFNNPVELVFAEALALSTDNVFSPESVQAPYHYPVAYIVSIGTGVMPSLTCVPSSKPIWGSVQRVKYAADLSIEQATECENAHKEMKKKCQLYNIPYFRFNTPLSERIGLDIGNENDLNQLIECTNQYMTSETVLGDIEKLCKIIRETRR